MVAPGKLKALVDTQSNPMAAIANPSMHTEPDGDEDYDDEEDDSEEIEQSGDPKARGNDLLGQWGVLGAHLKEAAGEIVDGAHEVGSDLLLAKIPEDTISEVEDTFDRMPEEIQHALAKYVSKLTPEDCEAVATALLDGHDGDTKEADLKLVSIYLHQLAAHAAEEVDPDDIADEEPEEDEDDADEADADAPADDAGDAPPEIHDGKTV